MNMLIRRVTIVLDTILVSAVVGAVATGQERAPMFEKDVLPILERHCFKCHGVDKREADLDLRTVSGMLLGGLDGPAVKRGHADKSLLIKKIQSGDMPPEGEGKLAAEEVALVRRWIESGTRTKEVVDEQASDLQIIANIANLYPVEARKYWAFQRPMQRAVPGVAHADRVRTPIDAFLLEKLEALGLSFSADADRRSLIRHLYFDLIGLPPSPEEIEAFVNDASPDAYEQLVDHLLESPHYGERWGRHWLDAAGYTDVNFDGDAAIVIMFESQWRYRDYVIRAFNANKPIDRFMMEQLSGDELVDWRSASQFDDETRDMLIATGFLRSVEDHTTDAQNGIDKRYDVLFEVMETVSSSMMGLTMACCRCHNHKYDPLPQQDYYRLMAVFEPSLNVHNWKKPNERVLPDVSSAQKAAADEHNANIDRQVKTLQATIDGVYQESRQRLTEARLAGLPEPIRGDAKRAVETPPEKRTEVEKSLAEKFKTILEVTPEQVEAALAEADRSKIENAKRQQAELQAQRKPYGLINALWDVGEAPRSRVLLRGNWNTLGEPIEAGFPQVLCASEAIRDANSPPGTQGASSGRRLAFAQWLISDEHPLTARVFVNRIWHHHFGRGIVATLGNFGLSSSPPSHPELLDWLAVDFQQHGWNLKRLHKQIVTSTAYRQSYQASPEALARAADVDPSNMLLWRTNMQRLDAEIVRDALLATSGRLDSTMGGPPIKFETSPNGLSATDSIRRSVYLLSRRFYPLKFLEIFDAPLMAVNCPQRVSSATVLQTFAILNSPFVLEESKHTAGRIRQAKVANDEEFVDRAYYLILSRPPSATERASSLAFLTDQKRNLVDAGGAEDGAREQAWTELCHMLMCTNEFIYVK